MKKILIIFFVFLFLIMFYIESRDITYVDDYSETQDASFYKEEGTPSKMDGFVEKALNDPSIMSDIQDIAQEENLTELLLDPEFYKAVTSNDVDEFLADPRFQDLRSDPRVKRIIE